MGPSLTPAAFPGCPPAVLFHIWIMHILNQTFADVALHYHHLRRAAGFFLLPVQAHSLAPVF